MGQLAKTCEFHFVFLALLFVFVLHVYVILYVM